MLFLWKTTKYGKIWIDGELFKRIITKRLPKDYYCQEVTFTGEKDLLNIQITAPEGSTAEDKNSYEDKFSALFERSGVTTQVNWLSIAPQDDPNAVPMWMLPVFWAGIAAALAALIHLGVKGILWTIFAAVAGYGVSWIFLTEDGQREVSDIFQHFRR